MLAGEQTGKPQAGSRSRAPERLAGLEVLWVRSRTGRGGVFGRRLVAW